MSVSFVLHAKNSSGHQVPTVSTGGEAYQFQCREIGEGVWEPCDHSRYMYCQKSPEMDTRVVQVQTLSAPSRGEQEGKEFSQFLSAVMTAAGLVRHGRQSKELSEYLGRMCMQYMTAAPSAAAPSKEGV